MVDPRSRRRSATGSGVAGFWRYGCQCRPCHPVPVDGGMHDEQRISPPGCAGATDQAAPALESRADRHVERRAAGGCRHHAGDGRLDGNSIQCEAWSCFAVDAGAPSAAGRRDCADCRHLVATGGLTIALRCVAVNLAFAGVTADRRAGAGAALALAIGGVNVATPPVAEAISTRRSGVGRRGLYARARPCCAAKPAGIDGRSHGAGGGGEFVLVQQRRAAGPVQRVLRSSRWINGSEPAIWRCISSATWRMIPDGGAGRDGTGSSKLSERSGRWLKLVSGFDHAGDGGLLCPAAGYCKGHRAVPLWYCLAGRPADRAPIALQAGQ